MTRRIPAGSSVGRSTSISLLIRYISSALPPSNVAILAITGSSSFRLDGIGLSPSIAPCASFGPGCGTGRRRIPSGRADQWWPQSVSSYAFDDGERLLLFDPLAVPEEILAAATDREPVVVLTAPWHERDARSLVERLGAPVFTPPPDTADDLVRKYGIARGADPGGLAQHRRRVAAVRGRRRGPPVRGG